MRQAITLLARKNIMVLRIIFILGLFSFTSFAQQYSLQFVEAKADASFRGISVADKNAVWVSGSKGWIGRSTDGGVNWTFSKVKGYEQCDFRSLYAFDSNNAVIANAGSPAYILRTADGGNSWKQVYENRDSAAFIDGMDFWGDKQSGLIHGDPINGRMLLLYTADAGSSWKELKGPELSEGEASFAASGTTIKCFDGKSVLVATGGMVSELYISKDKGQSWRAISTPMLSGSTSTGTYTMMRDEGCWLLAGGDYKRDSIRTGNFYYSTNEGKTWQAPKHTTRGYRECLAQTRKGKQKTMFAVGPAGIDISTDEGVNWKPLSDEKGFHVMKPSKDGKLMFLAGSNGKLAVMKTQP